MNWKDYTDSVIGDKETFTADEVRRIVRKTLEFECEAWITKKT